MRKAFTLIELLVVIVIIGIIASLTFVALNSVRAKARDTKRIADIRQIQSALEMYRNDNNVYPSFATSGLPLVGANGVTYMNKIPTSPNKADSTCSSDTYTYSATSPYSAYTISYCLGGAVQNSGPAACIAVSGNICTQITAPGTPILTVTAPGGNNLSWTVPTSNGGSAITNYKVYYSTTGGTGSYLLLHTLSGSTLSDSDNQLGGTGYCQYMSTCYYKVVAVNAVGEGTFSNVGTGNAPTCFLAGTLITMADGTLKKVEEIKAGDLVLSYDEKLRQSVVGEVLIPINHPAGLYGSYLIINDEIKVTANHRFFINGNWLAIGQAKLGDLMQDKNGKKIEIVKMEKINQATPTYNMEVEKYHNYYAGGILVHNAYGAP